VIRSLKKSSINTSDNWTAPRVFHGSLIFALCVLFSACGSAPKSNKAPAQPASATNNTGNANRIANPPSTQPTPSQTSSASGKGGYYKDDGPGDNPPPDLESVVEPIPILEAFSRSGNKPYTVFGKTYTPITDATTPYKQKGMASWYGKKFHGQKTSSGERYDMYQITAAHPILPIPSYARVTNLENGKQIIVRINDRGPFHSSRIIDLSYTAALKLGYVGKGSTVLEVERLLPEDIDRMAENRKNQSTNIASNQPIRQATPNSNPITFADVPSTKPAPRDNAPHNAATQQSIEDLIAAQENLPTEKFSQPEASVTSVTSASAQNAIANQSNGYYIQVGAYAIRANAEMNLSRFKQRLAKQLPDFDIVQVGSLYRLISGPFASRSEALSLIAQHQDLAAAKALVVQR
jgi:rare lipoprotein A